MSALMFEQASDTPVDEAPDGLRTVSIGSQITDLADIYEEHINLAIWQRTLPASVVNAAEKLLQEQPAFQFSATIDPDSARSALALQLGSSSEIQPLINDLAELVDAFCYLFEINATGLRLTCLDSAMCPRFHVDKVPCRLITTYLGKATEWLANDHIDRERLGPGSKGLTDEQSGLLSREARIQQFNPGDVGLLKGESWEGNEGAGLVHRSPQLSSNERRLLATLDFTI